MSKPKTAIQPESFTTSETAVRGLIASGKHKTALDQAKDLHKAFGTSASEELLIDAYIGRIQSLIHGGLGLEATALINLVRERYPAAKERLALLNVKNLAASGRIDELLAPLNDPGLSAERLALIEGAIQETVNDPAVIAACPALPAEHPLRQAASAIERAFAAVTSGPVSEDVLALPEVSRRSPLAPWKMLVAALAAMYRRDTQACSRYLAAIPPGSAPARLIPVIDAIQNGGKPGSALTGAGRELISQVKGSIDGLKTAARNLDEAFDEDFGEQGIANAVRVTVEACRRTAPQLVERLKQYVFIRTQIEEIPTKRVNAAMGGPPVEDAAFQRIYARSLEQDDQLGAACIAWHSFREMAVEEGWFPAKGPEAAAVYLHIAKLSEGIAPWEMEAIKAAIRVRAKEQPEAANIPLDTAKLYERASTLDPHPGAFTPWLEWAKKRLGPGADRVAERWRQARPRDIEPLLFLISSFEKRNAFPTALKYLAAAEEIDGINPDVRKARLRLTIANFLKQVQQKAMPAAATKTLEAITAMPQIQQGDRAAFVQVLHYILAKRRGELTAAQGHRDEVERLLGSATTAALLIYSVAAACKFRGAEKPAISDAERAVLPAILARVAAITSDLELPVNVPPLWVRDASAEFTRLPKVLDIGQLRSLGECAFSQSDFEFAYKISAEGLTRGVNTEAEFLLLRANALRWRNQERAMFCALAAACLARQRHESELSARAVDFLTARFKDGINKIKPAQIEQILNMEKSVTAYNTRGGGPDYSSLLTLPCDCPECRRARGEAVDPMEEDEEFDDDDPFEGIGPSLPPGLEIPKGVPPELAKLFVETMMDGMARNETPEETIERVGREMERSMPQSFLPKIRSRKRRR